MKFFLPVDEEGDANVGVGECEAGDGVFDLRDFGAVGFKEFSAGGGGVKQAFDVCHCARVEAGGLRRCAFTGDLPGVVCVLGAASEGEIAHGGNAGNSFSPKAKALNIEEVFGGVNF